VKKKKIRTKVLVKEYFTHHSFDDFLVEMNKIKQIIQENYLVDAFIGIDEYLMQIYAYKERLETDKEFARRCSKVEKEKQKRAEIKRKKLVKERKEYERLKRNLKNRSFMKRLHLKIIQPRRQNDLVYG